MSRLAPLPSTREGWIRLLKSALSNDIVPVGSYKAPLYFYPRIGADGSVVTNWGRPPADTAPGKKDSLKSKQSAVLMLLTPVEYAPTAADLEGHTPDMIFALTMRNGSLRTHSGQMAFPGGRSDKIYKDGSGGPNGKEGAEEEGEWEWESPEVTAQRETLEEVGVTADKYTILGTLRPLYSTPSKSWVTPVVAIANTASAGDAAGALLRPLPRPIIASPDEVASLHYLSLSSLLGNSRHTHHHGIRYYPYEAALERSGGFNEDAQSQIEKHEGKLTGNAKALIRSGALTGFVMPCFFAQNADPFTVACPGSAEEGRAGEVINGGFGTTASATRLNDICLYNHQLPEGMEASQRAADKARRIASGEAEASTASDSIEVLVRTTESTAPLDTPNCYQSGPSLPLGQVEGSIVARSKTLHYVHEADVKGATLVWGLTAFMLCDFIARLMAARMAIGGWKPSKEHPLDLTPMLSCSDVIVRDPLNPYGEKRTSPIIGEGTSKAPSSSPTSPTKL